MAPLQPGARRSPTTSKFTVSLASARSVPAVHETTSRRGCSEEQCCHVIAEPVRWGSARSQTSTSSGGGATPRPASSEVAEPQRWLSECMPYQQDTSGTTSGSQGLSPIARPSTLDALHAVRREAVRIQPGHLPEVRAQQSYVQGDRRQSDRGLNCLEPRPAASSTRRAWLRSATL